MQVILKWMILSSLFVGSVFAQGNQNCTPLGSTPPPLSVANLPCCTGLSINNAGRCDTIPVVDPALISCSNDSQCSGGSACLPQTTSVMFSGYSPTSTPEDYPKRAQFETQLAGITSPKDNGGSCAHSKECKSYNCVGSPGLCTEKKVCRLLMEGEISVANVNCGPNLVKASNGSCQKSIDSQYGLYAGLLENPGISSDDQCKMTIDPETKNKSLIAMRSIRAMEWLFSTITVMGENECLGIFPLLREEIGKPIYSARKNILKNYSIVMSQIETDFQTVLAAGEAYKASVSNNSQVVSQDINITYDGNIVSRRELGSRLSSGYEAMMLTYRKNLLNKSYEMAMMELLNSVAPKLSGLSTAMESWSNDAESWSLGTTVYNNRDCDGSQYEEKEWWDWDRHHYHPLKDRYANFYEVTGNNTNNSSIIQRDNVKKVLSLIGGFQNPEDAVAKFTPPVYVLMDPPMYGGMVHGNFGQLVDSSDGTGFAFFGWGGFRDHRKKGSLNGNGQQSLKAMHDNLKNTVKDFYENLKEDPQQKNFIFEPELVDSTARDCFDTGRTAKCSELDTFLDEVVDESFAHFLSYSMREAGSYTASGDIWSTILTGVTITYNNRYKDYFNDATSFRRKLLAKLEVDIQNLSMYYNAVIAERDKQNACIEKVANGIINSGILAGGNGGIQEGNYNNGGGSSLNSGTGAQAIKNQKLSPLTRNNYTFNLMDPKLSKIGDSAKLDGSMGAGSSSEGASVSSGIGATLAARMKSMKDKNAKAALAGVKVDSKIKAANDIMKSMGSKYGNSSSGNSAASMGASSASGGKAFGFGDGTGASTSGDKTNEIGNGSVGASQDTQNGNGQYGFGNSSGSATNSSEDSANDGTGMNDDEKNKLLSTVQDNKDQFQPNEEDGIFKVVSKAYVRNLDRILIRKKKIEPEASNLK